MTGEHEQTEGEHEQPFEKQLARLEEIVRSLEQGDISLEKSLSLFEEGVQLARRCSKRLDHVEGKLEQLLEVKNGHAITVPLSEDDAKRED